jgi:mono/diheme cytochrome c family protein
MHRNVRLRIALSLIALCLASLAVWCAVRSTLGSAPEKQDVSLAEADPAQPMATLDERFSARVQPFLKRYCFTCHGSKKQEAELDLSRDATVAAIAKNVRQWELVLERLQAQEMPPEDAPRRPRPDERAAVVAWLRELRDREIERNAGDPGPVLARRLSNAELDHTIRDLTGVDIRPTREFPVDPANQAGFDNSGESLTMSPALLKKYLAAARLVADHVVLKPEGFVFAPHPVVTDTDRDKYCVQRLMDFYERHQVDLADYFLAAWRFQHRAAHGKPKASLADVAREAQLSAKYLTLVSSLLTEPQPAPGPLGTVQTQWRNLPDDADKQDEVRRECERLRERVVQLRKPLTPSVDRLSVKGISEGSQSFVLWRNGQIAAQHMRGTSTTAGEEADANARFCRAFPDAFVVTERAPYYDASSSPKGRLLSAGFHLMQGYYRDDGPLCELVLDEAGRRELDMLWEELHFVTLDPMRQYKDFIFFERAEPPRFMYEATFDFARSEDKDATSAAKIEQLRDAYLAKARKIGASAPALEAIETYFVNISAQIRKVETARRAAEPGHLAALQTFATRAYRRPLAPAERDDLLAYYRKLRDQDQLSHEEAMRDSVAGILLSPHFCYRFDLAEPGTTARPLSDHALASRLSYFLWSSMPDAELLTHAGAGDLHQPDVLKAQTRRMLRDPRVRGLATEFGGNWLDFRRFEEHNSVDRERFPGFTNELRQAMLEEPIHYFMDLARRNRSILDLLYGNDTFVNRALGQHYGIPEPSRRPDEWAHIEGANRYGRGGLLPMAVFLTKNAPGLRTSPVKRGYWVVRRLLGEKIPPPPPTVPELPKDEANLGELTLPQVLARHREHKSCAACHRRFDSIGLVFEDYGPIGERRTKDLGGRPVQTAATFPDGKDRDGLAGLKAYLREKRQGDFVDNLCSKLFSYALGRSLLPSDRKALEEMRTQLAADGYPLGSLVEAIVATPQFRNRRGRDDAREPEPIHRAP